jgi:hypothetical protein
MSFVGEMKPKEAEVRTHGTFIYRQALWLDPPKHACVASNSACRGVRTLVVQLRDTAGAHPRFGVGPCRVHQRERRRPRSALSKGTFSLVPAVRRSRQGCLRTRTIAAMQRDASRRCRSLRRAVANHSDRKLYLAVNHAGNSTRRPRK